MVVEVKPAASALNNGKRLGKICRLHLGAGEFIMLDSLPVVSAIPAGTLCPGADRLAVAVRGAGQKPVHVFTDPIHKKFPRKFRLCKGRDCSTIFFTKLYLCYWLLLNSRLNCFGTAALMAAALD